MKDFCIGTGVCRKLKIVREMFVGVVVVVVVLISLMVLVSAAHDEVVVKQQEEEKSLSLATTIDAYEKIEAYGFPQGIVPHTIQRYTLESNGKFTLYLEGECKVLIQSKYPLEYDPIITGFLSYGQLQQLQGIRVQAFYVWWSITAVSRSSDHDLLFAFGIVSAKFPVENFDDPPICERKLSEGDAF